jgi:hypothetical protein
VRTSNRLGDAAAPPAAFAATLRDAGVAVTEVDAGTLSHAEVDAALGRPGDTVITPPVSRFLDACFALTP